MIYYVLFVFNKSINIECICIRDNQNKQSIKYHHDYHNHHDYHCHHIIIMIIIIIS